MQLPVINKPNGAQDAEICQACGGSCCQKSPGIAWPDDFGPAETLVDVLVSYLKTGNWAIDWGPDDIKENGDLGEIYYVRPAAVGKKRVLLHPGWGYDVCGFWTSHDGCSLEFQDRPTQCRMLIPKETKPCKFPAGYDKDDSVRAWKPFQAQIKEAMRIIKEQSK